MKCPFCGHLGDKVVDSRESKEGEVIRRRRECLDCGRRFTSYERIDEIPYMVIKKDGTRERFERQKLVAGLLKACEKASGEHRRHRSRGDTVEPRCRSGPKRKWPRRKSARWSWTS
jgi:transcriptional repressor NrdR